MGGVDDEIEDDLVELPWKTQHRRQVGRKIGCHFGDVFPFVARHRDRHFDGVVEIQRFLFLAAGMRELLHGVDNAGNMTHPLQRLLDGQRNLFAQIIKVGLLHGGFHRRKHFLRHGVGANGCGKFLVILQQPAQ